jgi:hypothetical protein
MKKYSVFRTALEPTHPPIQLVSGALSLGVKRPGRATDHSPPSSAEVKNAWNYAFTPQYVFMAWCLVKHRDNFTWRCIGVLELHPHPLLSSALDWGERARGILFIFILIIATSTRRSPLIVSYSEIFRLLFCVHTSLLPSLLHHHPCLVD